MRTRLSMRLRAARRLLRRRSKRLDERGSAAIEFAVIAPVFFFLMFVIAETALIFIAEQVMDNAVFETARLIRTGQVQQSGMSQADFRNQVCSRMAVFINCNSPNFYLEVKSYSSFAGMTMANPTDASENFTNPGAFTFGAPNDIVVLRAYYQWPTNKVFGSLSLKNLANGKRLIGSFAAFCNEPYQATTGGCGG